MKIMFFSLALAVSGATMAQDHVEHGHELHGHDHGAHEYTDVHPLVAAIPEVIPLHSYPDFVAIKAAGERTVELRSWPSGSEGRVIRTLKEGDEVAVFECPDSTQDEVGKTAGTWCIVEHDDVRGFVFSKHLP